jgi:hypothetical protein
MLLLLLGLLLRCYMQVAAPNPLPAGFQVQFYDMEGFKLSYIMGDMLTLFKVSSRCKEWRNTRPWCEV